MPLTGEAKKEYQRIYMRGRSNKSIQKVAASLAQTLVPHRGRPHKLTDGQEETAQAALALALRSKRLDLDRYLGKLDEKLEAKKEHTVAGVRTISEDNDAQLRAHDTFGDLLSRAGMIPNPGKTSNGGASITVNVLILPEEGESSSTSSSKHSQAIDSVSVEESKQFESTS